MSYCSFSQFMDHTIYQQLSSMLIFNESKSQQRSKQLLGMAEGQTNVFYYYSTLKSLIAKSFLLHRNLYQTLHTSRISSPRHNAFCKCSPTLPGSWLQQLQSLSPVKHNKCRRTTRVDFMVRNICLISMILIQREMTLMNSLKAIACNLLCSKLQTILITYTNNIADCIFFPQRHSRMKSKNKMSGVHLMTTIFKQQFLIRGNTSVDVPGSRICYLFAKSVTLILKHIKKT